MSRLPQKRHFTAQRCVLLRPKQPHRSHIGSFDRRVGIGRALKAQPADFRGRLGRAVSCRLVFLYTLPSERVRPGFGAQRSTRCCGLTSCRQRPAARSRLCILSSRFPDTAEPARHRELAERVAGGPSSAARPQRETHPVRNWLLTRRLSCVILPVALPEAVPDTVATAL